MDQQRIQDRASETAEKVGTTASDAVQQAGASMQGKLEPAGHPSRRFHKPICGGATGHSLARRRRNRLRPRLFDPPALNCDCPPGSREHATESVSGAGRRLNKASGRNIVLPP